MTTDPSLLRRAFAVDPREESYEIEEIEGEVPAFVRGTYYLNGPASFHRGDLAYRHWLDGDGMVASLRFDDRGVRFAARYVGSEKRSTEEAAGRALFRAFGTAFPGDRLLRGVALASPVNVSVYPFAGSLLAFGEQGLPWRLDPVTLSTRGEESFGRLSPITPFSAHPSFDLDSGEMVNFGISFASREPTLQLFRFAAQGELLLRRRVPLPYPCSVHDFALTPRFVVFYLSPYLLEVSVLLATGGSVMDALAWRPELGSLLFVLDRESGEPVAQLGLGERYCLHHVNAFEEGERLVVDVIELEEPAYPDYQVIPELFTAVRPAHPVRLRVDTVGWRIEGREELPLGLGADFPSVDWWESSRPYDRFFLLAISDTGRPGGKLFDRLLRFDWSAGGATSAYQAPPGRLLGGEPTFVGEPGGEEGVVVCQELDLDRERGFFLLFDASDLARGPVARLPLKRPIHLGFHATFARA